MNDEENSEPDNRYDNKGILNIPKANFRQLKYEECILPADYFYMAFFAPDTR